MTEPADPTRPEVEVNKMDSTPRHRALPNDDDALLAVLAEALASARHPRQDQLITDAQDAFSFASITDEFAALVFDSMWEDKLESASRSVTDVRALIFETTGVALEIEISGEEIVGQLTPPSAAHIEAERADGWRAHVDTDDLGSFTLRLPGTGPVRFHISCGGESTVTEWVNITT